MAANSADSLVGKTTAQVPNLVDILLAEEASMHVDNPTSVSFLSAIVIGACL